MPADRTLLIDGADSAILGYVYRCGQTPFVVYDYERLMLHYQGGGMTEEEAVDWIATNVVGAWMGAGTPGVLMRANREEIAEMLTDIQPDRPSFPSTMIRNLTPHPITLLHLELPPESPAARVEQREVTVGEHMGIPLVRATYGATVDLPEPVEGTLLVVSALVRAANPDRRDLASPTQLVRDAEGRIVGARALLVS